MEHFFGIPGDVRLDTASLLESNRNPPAGWTQRTYILRRGPFRYVSHRRWLSGELLADKASLSSGSRMTAKLAPGLLHLGVYKLRGGRFMHVEGPWDDLCSITLGGGMWEAVVQTESEGLMLLVQGELARRLLGIVRRTAAYAIEQQQGGNQSFVHAPSEDTRQLANLLRVALETEDPARRAAIAGELPTVVERLFPDIVPLMAEVPVPRSQRRQMALEYERRSWESLPVDGAMPDVDGETCTALGLTRRSLQLAVQEHFGLSCESLQRLIRLNYSHLLLSEQDAARNVTDAALAAGFKHLGRFSQHYRELFGQTPSETLSLGPRTNSSRCSLDSRTPSR